MKLSSILKGLCPSCHRGKVMAGIFSVNSKCSNCEYSFQPESGFYLGSMVVAYLLTAILTIPPMILLKMFDADVALIVGVPLIEFLFLGSFLAYYAKIFWLHLEFQMTRKLNGSK